MPDIIADREPSPKGSADTLQRHSLLDDFTGSLGNSLKSQANGAIQLFNKVTGGEAGQFKLAEVEQAPPGSSHWFAQLAGQAAGVALEFFVFRKAAGKIAGGATKAKVAAEALPLTARQIGRRAALDAGTGAFMGFVLTPTEERAGSNFFMERGKHAFSSALTFGTMGGLNGTLSNPIKCIGNPTLRKSIAHPLTSNLLSGFAAGVVGKESESVLSGNGPAKAGELMQHGTEFALVGLAVHGLNRAGSLLETRSKRGSTESAQDREPTPPTANLEAVREGKTIRFSELPDPRSESVRHAQALERGNRSPFDESVPESTFSSLRGRTRTRVAIVGGGVGGLLTAEALSKRGIDCLVLESGSIGAATTGKMGAMVTRIPDLMYNAVLEKHGPQTLRQMIESMRRSHLDVMRLARSMRDCELIEYNSQKISYEYPDPALAREFELLHRHDRHTSFVTGQEARALMPLARSALIFHGEGSLNPRKFSQSLAEGRLFRVFEQSPVQAIQPRRTGVTVHTEKGEVSADAVVLATGAAPPMFEHLQPYLEPIQCFASEARLPAGYKLRGNFFDSVDPDFSYFRMLGENRLLFGSAARFLNHEPALAGAPKLAENLSRLFPGAEIERQWTGTIFSTIHDGMPIVARHPQHGQVIGVTGLGGIGLVNGAASAREVLDILRGKNRPRLFAPERFDKSARAEAS